MQILGGGKMSSPHKFSGVSNTRGMVPNTMHRPSPQSQAPQGFARIALYKRAARRGMNGGEWLRVVY